MSEFITKDSGKRVEFSTGARRDTQEDKARFDLVPNGPLTRLAQLYARGAVKYGDNNWQKGMPISRYYASMLRHAFQWAAGDTEEDHLAAVVFNTFAIMHTLDQIKIDQLPSDLDDLKRG